MVIKWSGVSKTEQVQNGPLQNRSTWGLLPPCTAMRYIYHMKDQTISASVAADSSKEARANQIQVIGRAAAVLRALENEEKGLSLGQIAARVSLPRSTVQRIVAALEAEQFVISASSPGGIRLGPAMLRLAASVNTSTAELARPFITQLSEDLAETVDVSIPKGDRLIFVDQVVGSQRLRTVSAVGEAFPLFCTANGKAFLATLEDDEIVKRIGTTYEARTKNTFTKFKDLKADLIKIRACGYAIDAEEHALGITAVGILVYDMLGNPVMVSVPVPTARFEQKQKIVIQELLKTKKLLRLCFNHQS